METVFNGAKRGNYDKYIGIREHSERLAHYCFQNLFSADFGTPSKNSLVVTSLRLKLYHSLITFDVFVSVLPIIACSAFFLLCSG